jgi:hypothetical protein
MANTNFPRGLQPYGNCLRVTEYTLSAAYAQDLFIWDPVEIDATGQNVVIATAGTGNPITGSIVGIYDEDKVPLGYWDSGHSGIGYVIVADDPKQCYISQGDGDTSILTIIDANGNVNLIDGTGSTVNYRSGWQIDDSDTGGGTAGDQIRLIRPVNRVDNEVGLAYCDWLYQINNHTQSVGIVGVGV